MTPPDAVVNAPVARAHREEALRVIAPFLCDANYIKGWVQDGMWSGTAWAILDGTAQSLANLEAAVRREYEGRIAELEESLEMACQNPADGCDCPGCSYAAEVNSTELETLKNA